jgi:pimeloyl-ACP methyl ester carboxylesterase
MRTAFREGRVAADGGTLVYAEAGSGEAVIAIGESATAAPALEELANGRRVMLVAQDGSAPETLARRIAAALDRMGVARFDVIGHGAGAAAALWLGVAKPEAVGAIVLAAPTALNERGSELERRLPEMKRPVLALFGTNDRAAPPEEGGRYRAVLPDCHLMFVYEAAHEIASDRPEALAFIAREFFERRDLFIVSRASGLAFP